MRIDKNESVLVVIDIQERLFPHIDEHERLANNCKILISGIQNMKVPTLVTEQYSKGLGTTIEPVRDILDNYNPIEKMSFSCCGEDGFVKSLTDLNTKNIILCGIEAHVCVLQTALDLHGQGFQPVLIADCVGSRKQSDKIYAIERMRDRGIIVSTYESILFELCREAGTEQFKAISKLVK
jgi:nicotinamidase-related amidase